MLQTQNMLHTQNNIAHQEWGYELRQTPGRGEGIFATRDFQPGQITMKGFIQYESQKNTSHTCQVDWSRWVLHSGLNSKINHCCEPNCGVKVNDRRCHDYVAMKFIKAGEELTFDYAMENYKIQNFPEQCLCGAAKCRGKITGWRDLPEDRKQQYQGFMPNYLFTPKPESYDG